MKRPWLLALGLALALATMILLGRSAYNLSQYRLSWLDFSPRTAHAATLDQLVSSTESGAPGAVGSDDVRHVILLGTGLTGTIQGTMTIITDAVTASGSSGALFCEWATYASSSDLSLYGGGDQECGRNVTPGLPIAKLWGSAGFDTNGRVAFGTSPAAQTFYWIDNVFAPTSSSWTLDPTKYYSVAFVEDQSGTFIFGSSNPTAYRGAPERYEAPNYDDGTSDVKDIYMLWDFNAGDPVVVPDNPPTIEMYFPGDATASSSVPEFRNWEVSSQNLNANGTINVYYSRNLDTLGQLPPFGYWDARPGVVLPLSPSFNLVQKRAQLWFPPLPIPETYYVQAIYTFGAESASSSVVQFSVSPTGTIATPFTSSSLAIFYHSYLSTSTEAGVALCSTAVDSFLLDPIGNITDAMCAAFNPDPAALQSYSQLSTDLSTKPPFGYFAAVKAGLLGVAVTSTDLAMISASTTEAFSDIFTPIRTGLGVIIYLIGGVWLWNRARHLDI